MTETPVGYLAREAEKRGKSVCAEPVVKTALMFVSYATIVYRRRRFDPRRFAQVFGSFWIDRQNANIDHCQFEWRPKGDESFTFQSIAFHSIAYRFCWC